MKVVIATLLAASWISWVEAARDSTAELPQAGLLVHVGCGTGRRTVKLAETGRFLVHGLEKDAGKVEKARRLIRSKGLYGLVSVEHWTSSRLPYAENMVNLLIVEAAVKLQRKEIMRVLCPNGAARIKKGGSWTTIRKPWPDDMGQWTHPRHGADGNTVSLDRRVGPPRRIRWVAGPSQEINCLVTSGGRNFYAGVLARDSFNGLRLWERSLTGSTAQNGSELRLPRGSALPIAAGKLLLVVSDKKLMALDGATGKVVREYGEVGTPSNVLYVKGTVIVVGKQSVRAFNAETARPAWTVEAAEPRYVVAGDGAVYLVQGQPRRGEKCTVVSLDLATGKVRWQKSDYPWIAKIRGLVYHKGRLACEVSTLTDDKEGNGLHILSADSGKLLWDRTFVPGMNHRKQARAMFIGELLWTLEHYKCVGLDPRNGKVKKTRKAGRCHCFPPVATPRYMFAGEMDLTDLETGKVDANQITKAACGGNSGVVPANGLLYVFPKHCICWPMLRGYAALATTRPEGSIVDKSVRKRSFAFEKGVAAPRHGTAKPSDDDWPCYRHDAWRSGSTPAGVPEKLKVRWAADLGDDYPDGPITDDWRQNPFVKGPLTSPVISGGLVYVGRPDAHELVALDAHTGKVSWRYTANGRIDTPPTIYRGLCLFGVKSGWVVCLRADNGKRVWRRRAAPLEERIIAYGQLESPWPVPGSVLVVDGTAFFAAGRQSLADGGILVFAVKPSNGNIQWVQRLDSLPTKNFYGSSGLEFDNFDLLQREGDSVAMSRWLFDRATGRMTVKAKEAFAVLKTGEGPGAVVPRGCWSYAPRQQGRYPRRPLAVFRDSTLLSCSVDNRTLFRRDFDNVEKFDLTWITGWAAAKVRREKKGEAYPSQRLAENAKWSVEVSGAAAMVWAGDKVFVVDAQGGLTVLAAGNGKVLATHDLPAPVWDGMAAAGGRLFVSTMDGKLICLGR